MNFYVATIIAIDKHGLRTVPRMVTVKAKTSYFAEDKVRDWLGENGVVYQVDILEPIGYEDGTED